MKSLNLRNALISFCMLFAAAPLLAQASTASPPTSAASAPSLTDQGYKIGADDIVEIDVLGQSDFKSRVRVKTDGTVPLPFLGNVAVAGETPITLAQRVSKMLRDKGIYENPVVNVELVSYASRYVIVLGEFGSPGLVPVDREYRVSEIVARVGGLRASGAPYVIVTRANHEEMKLPFDKLASGSAADDPYVAPGDKLFVPIADKFFIYGAINSPGEFVLSDNMSLRKALARAGGVSPSGSEKRVKIFKNGIEEKKVDLERIVQPGDVIVVGERLF
jgi:polysaccharide export outer membrane protein